MIEVRRVFLKRLPQYSRPSPKMIPITTTAAEIWTALKPRISDWSGKSGFACANWKIDWLNHSPIDALTAIQVGARSQTWELRSSSRYRPKPTCADRAALASPAGSLTVRKMRNETAVQHGVEEERGRPEQREHDRGRPEASPEAEQRRALEAGGGLAPEQLVTGGDHRDVAQDRRDAGRRRRPFEDTGHAQDDQAAGDRREDDGERRRQAQIGGEPGHDHGDGPEDRSVEHHPVMALAVGQDPEDRRQHEFREVEQGTEHAQDDRGDGRAAVFGEGRQVDAQHRPGETGAEAQRESAGQHGPQRSIHVLHSLPVAASTGPVSCRKRHTRRFGP